MVHNKSATIFANHYIKSASWVSVAFPEATGTLSHDVG
jgi:hypothetical protein